MGDDAREELTVLLAEARSGDSEARERLTRAVYSELRKMAGALMGFSSGVEVELRLPERADVDRVRGDIPGQVTCCRSR